MNATGLKRKLYSRDKIVVEVYATGFVPDLTEKQLMKLLMAEGNPGNKGR